MKAHLYVLSFRFESIIIDKACQTINEIINTLEYYTHELKVSGYEGDVAIYEVEVDKNINGNMDGLKFFDYFNSEWRNDHGIKIINSLTIPFN